MLMELFGCKTHVAVSQEGTLTSLICDFDTLWMLLDAFAVQEPLWCDGKLCWIKDLHFSSLSEAHLMYNTYLVGLQLDFVAEGVQF